MWDSKVTLEPKQPDSSGEANQWRRLGRTPLGQQLVELLREERAIAPDKRSQNGIERRLGNLAGGGVLEFFSAVCPDYATEERDGVRRYTFNGLGDGIGIVAGRALEVHAKLAKLFTACGLIDRVRFTLAIADQEAVEENCFRVGVDREEFLRRLRRSQYRLMEEAARKGFTPQCPLLTEIDPIAWERSRTGLEEVTKEIPKSQIDHAMRVRQKLYERWAGQSLEPQQLLASATQQIAEYVAVGRFLASGERIVLGLDASSMAPFVQRGAGDTPVVYFRRPDY